jgi:hypothetical protein
MTYQIAVPSYERPEKIQQQTLSLLDRLKVNRDDVTIFLANEEQVEKYAEVARDWRCVVGVLGADEVRRWYHTNYYPKGTPIINMDDDISELAEKDENKLKTYTGTLIDIADEGFHLCRKSGARLWGINPTANGFYMKNDSVVGLRFICAIFFGSYAGDRAITSRDRPTFATCEDYEFSIHSYLQNGSVVRLEWLAPVTKYNDKGGIKAELEAKDLGDRPAFQAHHVHRIAMTYPELARVVIKSGNVPNVRLKAITKLRYPKQSHLIAEGVIDG